MPLYTIKHTTPLLPKQKDDLADAITSIHAGMFGAPRVFVNVHFDHANVEEEARVMYVGGKRVSRSSSAHSPSRLGKTEGGKVERRSGRHGWAWVGSCISNRASGEMVPLFV